MHASEPDVEVVIGRVLWELTNAIPYSHKCCRKQRTKHTIQLRLQGQSKGKPDVCAEKYRKGGMSLLLKISVKGKGVGVRWGRGRALHRRAR